MPATLPRCAAAGISANFISTNWTLAGSAPFCASHIRSETLVNDTSVPTAMRRALETLGIAYRRRRGDAQAAGRLLRAEEAAAGDRHQRHATVDGVGQQDQVDGADIERTAGQRRGDGSGGRKRGRHDVESRVREHPRFEAVLYFGEGFGAGLDPDPQRRGALGRGPQRQRRRRQPRSAAAPPRARVDDRSSGATRGCRRVYECARNSCRNAFRTRASRCARGGCRPSARSRPDRG